MTNRAYRLSGISWEKLQELSIEERANYFNGEEGPFSVLFAQQFDRKSMEELCTLATRIRHIAKTKTGMDFLMGLLAHKSAMLYFTQPSTRTFLSFHSACQILGIRIVEVRDTSTSSEMKGETQEDSIRTFSSFADVIIMRSAIGGLAEKMAWLLAHTERPVPIINAGSGKDQHPTQALLDIYTLQRSFERRGGIDGKKIAFVGDLLRGRTVRSLACLLRHYSDVKLFFVAPDSLQIKEDILKILDKSGTKYELLNKLKPILGEVDAVYMTRIQDEWDESRGESAKLDLSEYKIGVQDLQLMRPHSVIMHPLPRRDEIAADVDNDARAVYWRQVRNGMWIRVALIASIFDCKNAVIQFHGT